MRDFFIFDAIPSGIYFLYIHSCFYLSQRWDHCIRSRLSLLQGIWGNDLIGDTDRVSLHLQGYESDRSREDLVQRNSWTYSLHQSSQLLPRGAWGSIFSVYSRVPCRPYSLGSYRGSDNIWAHDHHEIFLEVHADPSFAVFLHCIFHQYLSFLRLLILFSVFSWQKILPSR